MTIRDVFYSAGGRTWRCGRLVSCWGSWRAIYYYDYLSGQPTTDLVGENPEALAKCLRERFEREYLLPRGLLHHGVRR